MLAINKCEYYASYMAQDIEQVMQLIRSFREERDWMQFHNPKNLAMSIAIEAAEIMEHFQWKTFKEAEKYAQDHKDEIAEEMADVAAYLFELSDNLGIDLIEAMEKKITKNAAKYPVEKAKGIHTKYTHL